MYPDLTKSIEIVDNGTLSTIGSVLWVDKNYTIRYLPTILDGLAFGKLPYKLQTDVNLVIDIDQVSILYIAIHPDSYSENLTNWLQTDNWSEIKEYIVYDVENGYEMLSHIWHKELVTTKEIKVSNGFDQITFAIFIKPGNI